MHEKMCLEWLCMGAFVYMCIHTYIFVNSCTFNFCLEFLLCNSKGRKEKGIQIQNQFKMGRRLLLDHLNGSTVKSVNFCCSSYSTSLSALEVDSV